MVETSKTSPIRVDFVAQAAHGLPGRLGLTIAPGKRDGHWARDLQTDLRCLCEQYGTDILVSLLEPIEYWDLRITDLREAAMRAGIKLLRLSIRDVSVPTSIERCEGLVRRMMAALASGKTVVVHCRGGLGRSGLVAACCLVECGRPATDAIRAVREARPGAIETQEQEGFVHRFAETWRKGAATQ